MHPTIKENLVHEQSMGTVGRRGEEEEAENTGDDKLIEVTRTDFTKPWTNKRGDLVVLRKLRDILGPQTIEERRSRRRLSLDLYVLLTNNMWSENDENTVAKIFLELKATNRR